MLVDRQIVYPGGIPLDTDILNLERNVMVALGYLAQATLGTGMVADGLACAATQPASMSVTVGPGCVTQFGVVDTLAFGSLPAQPTEPLLKMGVNVGTASFVLTAPTASGEAIDYLLEASFLENDASPVILPYYNAASPGMPYSGPGNSGVPQNTQRLQSVQFQLKAGAPGGAGTQLLPNVDAGWIGLYAITVTTGQTAITAANITTLADAPFISWKLPQLSPGASRITVFTPANQGNWSVPAGVSTVKVRVWGGGGGGGAGFSGAGGGGAGGGYVEAYCGVTPGQSYFVTVGNGGAGAGTNGGNSSFGNLTSASGGQAGANGGANTGGSGGATGGAGAGGSVAFVGQAGGSAFLAGNVWVSGKGGGAYGGSGAEAAVAGGGTLTDGHAASLPGCGGAGGIGSGLGGQGGAGVVLLEY
jgi:hypothetical protein